MPLHDPDRDPVPHFVESIRGPREGSRDTGNVVVIALVALLGIVVPLATPLFHAEVPELDVLARSVALLAWLSAGLAVGILLALMAFWKRETWQWQQRLFWSTVAVAVVTIFPQIFVITFLLPPVNEMVSTRPLVRALRQQSVEGPEVGLWRTPHLWTRDMPESYRRVEYMGSDRLQQPGAKPLVIVTRAERAHHLGPELRSNSQGRSMRIQGRVLMSTDVNELWSRALQGCKQAPSVSSAFSFWRCCGRARGVGQRLTIDAPLAVDEGFLLGARHRLESVWASPHLRLAIATPASVLIGSRSGT